MSEVIKFANILKNTALVWETDWAKQFVLMIDQALIEYDVAAEREVARLRDIISPGDAAAYEECAANMQARLNAAESQLTRLREPLTDEECVTNLAGYARAVYLRAGCECEAESTYAWPSAEGLATWTGVVRAAIAKFFELREVKS